MSLERLVRAGARWRPWIEALLVAVSGALALARPGDTALLASLTVLMAGLAARSRIAPEPGAPWAMGLEAIGVAFAGLSPRAGLALVAIAAAARGLPSWREPGPLIPASVAARRVVGVFAAAALVTFAASPSSGLVLLPLLVLEAYGPRVAWTRDAAGRRAAGFGLATALALAVGREGPLGTSAADVLTSLLALVALERLFVVLARLIAAEELTSLEALARRAGDLGERGERTARALSRLASVLFCGVLALHAGALQVRVERPIGSEALISNGGQSFSFPAAILGSDAWGGHSSLEVLEDGRPLPLGHMPHDQIRALGRGRFCHWYGVVHLSSSDGTDPRANGRRYALRFDARPGFTWSVLVVLVWGLVHSRRMARAYDEALAKGSAFIPVFAVTGIVLLGLAAANMALPERSHVEIAQDLAPDVRAAVESREARSAVPERAGLSLQQPVRVVVGPVSIAPLPVAIAAFGLAACAAASGLAPWLRRRGPRWWCAGFVGLALGYRLLVAWRHGRDALEGCLLKGVPVSDGDGWSTLAREFSLGERWDSVWGFWGARRPLYYLVFAPYLTFTGPSVLALQAGSLLMSAFAVGFVFDLVRRLASVPVAFVAALGQALFLLDARLSLLTTTESLGAFLTIVALWFLVRSAERLATRQPAGGLAAASGAVFALANLARPLNLQALAVLPVALALVVSRRGVTRFRTLLTATLLFWLGAILTLAPWVARQRIVHGIWTISENTADMLFAATSPRYGSWNGAVSDLVAGLSFKDRAAFFQQETRQNLQEHAGWYVGHVAECFGEIVQELSMQPWLMAGAILGLSATILVRRPPPEAVRRVTLLTGGLLLLSCLPQTGRVLWILGILFALVRRDRLLLVVALATATVGGMAILGISERRFLSTLQWPVSALGAHALAQLFERTVSRDWLERPWLRGEVAPRWGSAARVPRLLALALAALFAVGVVRVVARNLGGPSRPPLMRLDALAERPWIEGALAGECRVFEALRDRLEVRRTRLVPDHVASFEAGEVFPGVAPRAYGYTLFATRPKLPENFGAFTVDPRLVVRGEEQELVLVGLHAAPDSFEVIALGLAQAGPQGLVRAPQATAARHAEHLRRMLTR